MVTVFGETLQLGVMKIIIEPTSTPETESRVTEETEIVFDIDSKIIEETKDTTEVDEGFTFKNEVSEVQFAGY